ncbi:MAG TPA: D-aminoacylase [Armatimonadota bacterium]|jgi:N-acyl-D-amino-acid deacylase
MQDTRPDTYDLIIAGGTLVDGSGGPPVSADVGVQGDTIAAIGDLSDAHASHRLSAEDQVVSPGFIDIHTHTDVTILAVPGMESSLYQGVTTQLGGNCGLCVGMTLDNEVFGIERRLVPSATPFSWSTLDEYLRRVAGEGISGNFGVLAGHGTLRKRVIGREGRAPTTAELADMRAVLAEAMEEGAFGLSTGLEYPPGRFSETEELIEVSRELTRFGGFYASHLRDEADGLLDAVSEAIRIGREADVPVQLSHHKAEGRRNWGRVADSLALVDSARAAGQDVSCDVYPYTSFMTGLAVRILPGWAQEGSMADMAARFEVEETRSQILEEIRANGPDWDLILIAVCPGNRAYQGLTVAALAQQKGMAPEELVLDLLSHQKGMIAAINFQMAEEDVETVLRRDYVSVGSDGAAASPTGPMRHDKPHPRTYGTFPRVLGRYVRERGVLSLEEAVRRMTLLPASRIGLKDRGLLREGYKADLVVFDPATVDDSATYEEPHQFPTGIGTVVVNGQMVIRDGAHTGARPGTVLRRGS